MDGRAAPHPQRLLHVRTVRAHQPGRASSAGTAVSSEPFAVCGSRAIVAGGVVGWGRVIQHGGQGWRAEYGRPIGLLDTGHPLLEMVARRYNVPILSHTGLQLTASENGELLADVEPRAQGGL